MMALLYTLAATAVGLLIKSWCIQRQANKIGQEIEEQEKEGPPKV